MTRNRFHTAALVAGVLLGFCGVAKAAPLITEHQDSLFSSAEMIRVGDRLNLPLTPPTPGSTRKQTRVSAAQAGANVAVRIEAKFVQAAGSSDGLLTRQAALAIGWGWAADHFNEIDRQHAGKVTLDEVLDYVNKRSSLTLPRAHTD